MRFSLFIFNFDETTMIQEAISKSSCHTPFDVLQLRTNAQEDNKFELSGRVTGPAVVSRPLTETLPDTQCCVHIATRSDKHWFNKLINELSDRFSIRYVRCTLLLEVTKIYCKISEHELSGRVPSTPNTVYRDRSRRRETQCQFLICQTFPPKTNPKFKMVFDISYSNKYRG